MEKGEKGIGKTDTGSVVVFSYERLMEPISRFLWIASATFFRTLNRLTFIKLYVFCII